MYVALNNSKTTIALFALLGILELFSDILYWFYPIACDKFLMDVGSRAR